MIVMVQGKEIDCPDTPKMLELVKGMNLIQTLHLCKYQKQVKNWPKHGNIPTYCLYMGSGEFDGEKVDFYHYEPGKDGVDCYSTGIVTGEGGGDYRSGWPELAVKRAVYKEHMRREFLFGFLTVDDLVRVGVAALGSQREGYSTIRPMRGSFKLVEEES